MQDQSLFKTIERIQNAYRETDFILALQLAESGFVEFPEKKPLFYFWRLAINATMGRESTTLDLLGSALEEGIWFSQFVLRESQVFSTYQNLPRFAQLLERNHDLQMNDPDQKFPMLLLHSQETCHPGSTPCPLLIGLHAEDSSARKSLPYWQTVAASGWLVAVPQSSQAKWKGAYIWDDRWLANKELAANFIKLNSQFSIDNNRILLAGISSGGETAFWLALTGEIISRGFIAINPSGPIVRDPGHYLNDLEQAFYQPIKGSVIIESQEPGISKTEIISFVNKINEIGIDCRVEEIAGVDRSNVPHYEAAISKAIDFILK